MSTSVRRRGLLGSASLAVLILGTMGAAQAQTTITVGNPVDFIDYLATSDGVAPDENILNDASTTGAGAGTTNILSFQTIQGVATGTATTGDSDVSILSVAGDNSTFDADGNDIFSQVRGNNVSSSIGTSDATDGAVILNAQETVPTAASGGTALAALSDGNEVTITLTGNGQNVTSGVTENSISARGSFNTAFATVETTVPTTLEPGGGSYEATYAAPPGQLVPESVNQEANYNVASVQVNSGFENGQTDPGIGTSHTVDAEISLTREYSAPGGVFVTGTYEVLENAATATTLGNAADNSIFLLSGEASTFDGTAIASSTQISRELDNDDEPPISATNVDSTIGASFANIDDGIGGANLAAGNGMTADVDDNTIGSTASINSSRNELGFDSALDLDGAADLAFVSVGYSGETGLNTSLVNSDFAVVNVQTAFPGLVSGAFVQSAYATTDSGTIGLFIEDVDGDSTLSVSGNAVNATASGNVGTNVIRNSGGDLGDDSSLIAGTFASVNQQMLWRPDIQATTQDGDIAALVGTLAAGAPAFGGLAGSTLDVDGNAFRATANGSVATSLIDLSGQSLEVSRPEGAGGGIIADREGPSFFNGGLAGTQFSEISTAGGVTIANLQLNAQGVGPDGNLASLVTGNEIFAAVNFDGGTGDVDAQSLSGSTVSVDGNDAVASTTINGFDGLARLAANTVVEADVSVGSSQTVGGIAFGDDVDATATTTGNNIGSLLGLDVGGTSNLAATVDSNAVLALVSGNDSSLGIEATAGTELHGHGLTLPDPAGPAPASNAYTISSSEPTEETLNTDAWAAAAFLVGNDQALTLVDLAATVSGNTVGQALLSDGDGTVNLFDTTISSSGNSVIGQILGNSAANSIDLEAGTSIGFLPPEGVDEEPGAIAGIYNSQTAAVVEAIPDIDITLDVDVADNSIGVDVLSLNAGDSGILSNITANADDNVIQGLGFVNVAGSLIVAGANTISTEDSDGVDLLAVIDGSDQVLAVSDAGFYVVNRQRNEGLNAEALDEPGASTDVDVTDNEILLTVNAGGSGSGGASSSSFGASGNDILGTGAANVANNLIATTADTTSTAAAGILNRQGNSGDVNVLNSDSLIELSLAGVDGATHSDVTLDLNQNVIGASSTGSSVSNAINASAGTTLNGTNSEEFDGIFVGATPPTDAFAAVDTTIASVDTNPDSTANGNLVILSTQRNYGTTPDGVVPSLITSATENAAINLSVADDEVDSDNLTLTLNGNVVRSQAVANAAGNAIDVDSGTGGPASATVLNNQGAADTTASASVLNSEVTADIAGNLDEGTIGVTNNAIVASADLNNATNTITASAAVGVGLENSTVANYQSASGSSVSTSVTGSSISTTSGVVGGGVSNSTVTASGNQIGTSSTINNSVNRIASPGQGFTRTSTF